MLVPHLRVNTPAPRPSADRDYERVWTEYAGMFMILIRGEEAREAERVAGMFRDAWVREVGVRAHDVRMPWDEVLARPGEGREGDGLSGRHGGVGVGGLEEREGNRAVESGVDRVRTQRFEKGAVGWGLQWRTRKGTREGERVRKEVGLYNREECEGGEYEGEEYEGKEYWEEESEGEEYEGEKCEGEECQSEEYEGGGGVYHGEEDEGDDE